MKRFNFNFSFHPIDSDGNGGKSAVIGLFCEGIPHTCGLYFASTTEGAYFQSSYIFKGDHPVPCETEDKTAIDSEENVQKQLIARAVTLILKYHADKINK